MKSWKAGRKLVKKADGGDAGKVLYNICRYRIIPREVHDRKSVLKH